MKSRSPRILIPEDPTSSDTTLLVLSLGQCAIKTDNTPWPSSDARCLFDCIRIRNAGVELHMIQEKGYASITEVPTLYQNAESSQILMPIGLDADVYTTKVPSQRLVPSLRVCTDRVPPRACSQCVSATATCPATSDSSHPVIRKVPPDHGVHCQRVRTCS